MSKQTIPPHQGKVKLLIETTFMKPSGSQGGVPVMSRAGRVSAAADPAFMNENVPPPMHKKVAVKTASPKRGDANGDAPDEAEPTEAQPATINEEGEPAEEEEDGEVDE